MISFVNIYSNERVSTDDPHHIAAFINSSDLGTNASKGQDFGWRLAPEVVVKIEDMSQNMDILEKISRAKGIGVEDISTIHLVQYISELDRINAAKKERQAEREPAHKKDYEAEIEALRNRNNPALQAEWNEVPSIEPVDETATTLAPAEPAKKSTKK